MTSVSSSRSPLVSSCFVIGSSARWTSGGSAHNGAVCRSRARGGLASSWAACRVPRLSPGQDDVSCASRPYPWRLTSRQSRQPLASQLGPARRWLAGPFEKKAGKYIPPEVPENKPFQCSDGRNSLRRRRSAARVEQGDLFKFYARSRSLISAQFWHVSIGALHRMSLMFEPVGPFFTHSFENLLQSSTTAHAA